MRNQLLKIGSYMLTGIVSGIICFLFLKDKTPGDSGQPAFFTDKYVVRPLLLPAQLEFAGEKIPLERFDVREGLDRELLVNTYWQSKTLILIKRANRFFPIIEPILKKYGIPDDFKYIAAIESDLSNVVSPAKAAGYWQFLASAGKEYGLEVNEEVDMRYQIEASTEAACRYLRSSYNKFGNWTMAAASYNMGAGGLQKQALRQHQSNYFDLLLNDETARYVYRILAAKLILENPKGYGFQIETSDMYPPYQLKTVKVDSAINDLVNFAEKMGVTYKTLKMYNPWLRDSKLTNKNRQTYNLQLPQ
jgi:hypothetical protein